jgi:hypothetical protein
MQSICGIDWPRELRKHFFIHNGKTAAEMQMKKTHMVHREGASGEGNFLKSHRQNAFGFEIRLPAHLHRAQQIMIVLIFTVAGHKRVSSNGFLGKYAMPQCTRSRRISTHIHSHASVHCSGEETKTPAFCFGAASVKLVQTL